MKAIADVSAGLQVVGLKLANKRNLCGFDCLLECIGHEQRALDRLARAATPFGMLCAFSNAVNSTSVVPSLILNGETQPVLTVSFA